jgi:hypothetical protein
MQLNNSGMQPHPEFESDCDQACAAALLPNGFVLLRLGCAAVLLPCSLQHPVKWFVVVSGLQVASGRNAIAYQLKHLQEFPQDEVGKWGADLWWCAGYI